MTRVTASLRTDLDQPPISVSIDIASDDRQTDRQEENRFFSKIFRFFSFTSSFFLYFVGKERSMTLLLIVNRNQIPCHRAVV